MVDSATPETGTDTAAPPSQTPDEKALVSIDSFLEPEGDQETPDAPPKATQKEEPGASDESEEAEPAKAAEKPPEEESAPEAEGEQEELPATLSELAEAFEMESDALSEHLKVQVKVNGVASEVTLGEAIKGYSREADYTQGKMRHAEVVKAFEAETAGSKAHWQQQMGVVEDMISALAGSLPNINDETLLSKYQLEDGEFDHSGYLYEKAAIERSHGNVQEVFGQLQAQRDQFQKEQADKQKASRAEHQQQLIAADPEFSDPVKVREFEASAGTLLTSFGLSREEVGAFFAGDFHPVQIRVLKKALQQDALEKSQPKRIKKLKELPKVTRPGVASEKDNEPGDRFASAKQRLRKAGRAGSRVDIDAAALELIDEKFLGGVK